MIKRLAIALSLTVIAATSVLAQAAPETATLTAEGTGTVHAAPDMVIIDIGVATRGATPAEALAGNNTDMQRVIQAVIAAGVDERDIATSNFSISPVYDDQQPIRGNAGPAIVGYEVSNQVTVRINGVANSGGILDQVVAAGANRINSIRFDIAEPQPLRDEALAAAIAEARRQAELMADAAGVTLVRVIGITSYANAQPMYDRVAFAAASNTPIMGGEQAITATATLTFEIAPR
ncbi:MAG: SIMPL domain-containing protein [Bauldia sp.]|nr:SIMPL domain-containing protein [Bauldia sp.]